MPGLRELQEAFRQHLMSGDPAVAAYIAGTKGRSSGERLAVYANAYRARLAEALATDYEALRAVMGEEGFLELCHDYVDAHPSTSCSLRWLGQHLPDKRLCLLAELKYSLRFCEPEITHLCDGLIDCMITSCLTMN